MTPRRHDPRRTWLAALVALLMTWHCAYAEPSQDEGEDPHAGIRLPVGLSDGVPIQRVYFHLKNPPQDPVKAAQLKKWLQNSLGLWAGDPFNFIIADEGIQRIRAANGVETAEYRLYQSEVPGLVVLALLVQIQDPATPADEATPTPGLSEPLPPVPTTSPTNPTPTQPDAGVKPPRGLLVDGDNFPILFENADSKTTLIVNGSFGLFSDTDAWFANGQKFVAPPYNPSGTVSWPEANLELGLGGITRLSESPAYLYGAGSYLVSSTDARDTFNPDARLWGAIEKLYGGILVADPDSPVRLNLSAGRQHFQLNNNYLFGYIKGSVNALERGGTYTSPRVAYQSSVLGRLRVGDVSLQGFYLNPDELPSGDSDTRYLGANLAYNNNDNLEASLAYVTVPQSNSPYSLPNRGQNTREGLWLVNPRLRMTSLFGVDGLWMETEYVHQGNTRFPMSAYAAYGWLGYTSKDDDLKPGGSYRYAIFSGDNPNTPTYERFDAIQSGGLGSWLQGISMGKVFPNSNLRTHNLNFRIWPQKNLELSLDYFYLYADQLNNRGGQRALSQLSSRDLGQEVMLTSRHYLNTNLFLLGVASVAFPGDAVRSAFGSADPWWTLNLSLWMNL